jgi:hypothetical protein
VQILDRKYRLFGVINIIDLLVVIALVVGGLVVWKVLWGGGTSAAPVAALHDVEYTALCSTVRVYSDGMIKAGDPVSTKTSGKSIGTVVSVRSTPTPGDVLNPMTGKVGPYESSVFLDVYIQVKAKGDPTPTGVSVGNTQLRNNEIIQVVTPTFQCDTALVSDLKIVGE